MGNTRPGDGWRFRGRGLIQLTGRANYAAAGAGLGLPLEEKPELLEQPEHAAMSAACEREKEQARQQSMNKAIQDGQKIIDEALADAAAARAANGSLRDTAEDHVRRLEAQARNHPCTAATSQTAACVAMVFADVFERADERAGDLAAVADQSRGRGVVCEPAYLSLGER
ncbi:DUF2514 family protein [Pseudomonas donghuensis]|nr:DUF2514 family protein [Pseudomonas donghuensis]